MPPSGLLSPAGKSKDSVSPGRDSEVAEEPAGTASEGEATKLGVLSFFTLALLADSTLSWGLDAPLGNQFLGCRPTFEESPLAEANLDDEATAGAEAAFSSVACCFCWKDSLLDLTSPVVPDNPF